MWRYYVVCGLALVSNYVLVYLYTLYFATNLCPDTIMHFVNREQALYFGLCGFSLSGPDHISTVHGLYEAESKFIFAMNLGSVTAVYQADNLWYWVGEREQQTWTRVVAF